MTPVNILRDTGASQALVLESVLLFSDNSYTGAGVFFQGFELGFVHIPLHRICLKSNLISCTVNMGLRPILPVKGVSILLGNDLAEERVVPDPIVVEKHHCTIETNVETQVTGIVCTRSKSKEVDPEVSEVENDSSNYPDTLSRGKFITEQGKDSKTEGIV